MSKIALLNLIVYPNNPLHFLSQLQLYKLYALTIEDYSHACITHTINHHMLLVIHTHPHDPDPDPHPHPHQYQYQ